MGDVNGMVAGPGMTPCREDHHRGHDGAAVTPASPGSPGQLFKRGVAAIGPGGSHRVVLVHVATENVCGRREWGGGGRGRWGVARGVDHCSSWKGRQ